jgi:hypothetical protein
MDVSILHDYIAELEEKAKSGASVDEWEDPDDTPVLKQSSKTRPNQRLGSEAPEFVNWVPGSTAGAGSEQFHIYRHLRAKEYYRLKQMELAAKKVSRFICTSTRHNPFVAVLLFCFHLRKRLTRSGKRKRPLRKRNYPIGRCASTVHISSSYAFVVTRQSEPQSEKIEKIGLKKPKAKFSLPHPFQCLPLPEAEILTPRLSHRKNLTVISFLILPFNMLMKRRRMKKSDIFFPFFFKISKPLLMTRDSFFFISHDVITVSSRNSAMVAAWRILV